VETKKKLPVGIEKFSDFFTDDFYYVDKTGLIIDFLSNWGKVNLFTRPRRFGKSLNMDMLKSFFEIGCNKSLFDGLKVSQYPELCNEYMGQFPVISISLKSVGSNIQDPSNLEETPFVLTRKIMKRVVGEEARRFSFLSTSDKLTDEEKKTYASLIETDKVGSYSMSNDMLEDSLRLLSYYLSKHYDKQVIIIIDEYDVPLDKAFQYGYYDQMVSLIRNLFSSALKTNSCLQFAIITGCLRISKESIFTGMNNLKIHTITDWRYDEYFGFTDEDVIKILEYYGLSEHYDKVKIWYDGYNFGNVSVYCPWDVINYCDEARVNPNLYPQNYWANTSGNDLVRQFINQATTQTKNDIEKLVAGETVTKPIKQELTYREIGDSIENIWSVLFTTGYLTQCKCIDGRTYELAIPNLEVKELFVTEIEQWFKDASKKDNDTIRQFCEAFPNGDVQHIEKQLNKYLWNSISIRDTAVRNELKENFYHGMLLGLLQFEDEWKVQSNVESGIGYGDIVIETPDRIGIVIELKYAKDNKLIDHCNEALAQIEENQYDAVLMEDGMESVVKYGIAFYKKICKVVKGEEQG
jgi:hypothetical protein